MNKRWVPPDCAMLLVSGTFWILLGEAEAAYSRLRKCSCNCWWFRGSCLIKPDPLNYEQRDHNASHIYTYFDINVCV